MDEDHDTKRDHSRSFLAEVLGGLIYCLVVMLIGLVLARFMRDFSTALHSQHRNQIQKRPAGTQ